MGKKEPEFEGKFTGVFVDDEDLVRTGRAWMEVTSGNGVVHIPLSEEHHKLREQVRADAESAASNRKAVDESLRVIKLPSPPSCLPLNWLENRASMQRLPLIVLMNLRKRLRYRSVGHLRFSHECRNLRML